MSNIWYAYTVVFDKFPGLAAESANVGNRINRVERPQLSRCLLCHRTRNDESDNCFTTEFMVSIGWFGGVSLSFKELQEGVVRHGFDSEPDRLAVSVVLEQDGYNSFRMEQSDTDDEDIEQNVREGQHRPLPRE